MGNKTAVRKNALAPERAPSRQTSFCGELPGTVHAQYRRRGSKVYGPYYFHFWREGRRLRKRYIKKADLHEVHALCQNRRNRRSERSQSASMLTAQRLRSREAMANLHLFAELFAVQHLMESKDEDQLTPLQRKRVIKLLARFD